MSTFELATTLDVRISELRPLCIKQVPEAWQ